MTDKLRFPERDEKPREFYGPVTLEHMSWLYREYQRALKLAEYNRDGRNPRFPGDIGRKVGETLQAKADRLLASFPRFGDGE